jgi:hypothetical protein
MQRVPRSANATARGEREMLWTMGSQDNSRGEVTQAWMAIQMDDFKAK